MENPADNHRTILVISLRTDRLPGRQAALRGTLRTVDGVRVKFNSFTELQRILGDLIGWQEPPAGPTKDTLQTA